MRVAESRNVEWQWNRKGENRAVQFSRLQARCTFTAALTGHTIPIINSAHWLSSPIIFSQSLYLSLSLSFSFLFLLLTSHGVSADNIARSRRSTKRTIGGRAAIIRIASRIIPLGRKSAVRNRRPATDPIANYLAPIRLGRHRALCWPDVTCYRARP